MNKKLVLVFACVSFCLLLSGCTEKTANTEWSGVVWDAGKTRGEYWIVLETELGNKTKVVGSGDYGFLLSLEYPAVYNFYFYYEYGYQQSTLELVRVEDENGGVIWIQ